MSASFPSFTGILKYAGFATAVLVVLLEFSELNKHVLAAIGLAIVIAEFGGPIIMKKRRKRRGT